MSIINTAQKMRGRPKVDSEEVKVRIERADLDSIDRFAAENDLRGRPEAIRRLVRKALQPDPASAK
jgi:metal-responsive CopG/Arc/MetJ family transcriptional regulator